MQTCSPFIVAYACMCWISARHVYDMISTSVKWLSGHSSLSVHALRGCLYLTHATCSYNRHCLATCSVWWSMRVHYAIIFFACFRFCRINWMSSSQRPRSSLSCVLLFDLFHRIVIISTRVSEIKCSPCHEAHVCMPQWFSFDVYAL